MSSGELLLTLTVALIVFGPSKLPMLAKHLAIAIAKYNQLKNQTMHFWQSQMALKDNEAKADVADLLYRDKEL